MIIKQIFNNLLISLFGMQLIRAYPRPFERHGLKGNNLIGAEIGVYRGKHAKSMLDTEKIKKLYLIDPYEKYSETNDLKDLKETREKAYNLLKDEEVEFIYKKSEEVIKDIPDDLDFIYIDGAHDYDNIKKDIENYWNKVKVGGIFGGHDFGKTWKEEDKNGVLKAVMEFVNKYGLKLYVEYRDWWVIKEIK